MQKSSGSFVDVMEQLIPGYTVDGAQEDQDDHKTALHLAIIQRDNIVTEILLKAGADLNAMDCFETTALGFAVQGENVSSKIIELMVHYAHKINFGSEQNQIALLHAVKSRSYPIIELITSKAK